MSFNILKDFIKNNHDQLIHLPLAPFAGLGVILGPEYLLDTGVTTTPDQFAEVKFHSIDANLVLYLRHLVQTAEKNEKVDVWAEKLLRYAEIKKRPPKRLTFPGCTGYKCAASLLSAFFLEHYATFGDIRFFNTALKMNDIANKKRKVELYQNANTETFLAARNATLENYFLERL